MSKRFGCIGNLAEQYYAQHGITIYDFYVDRGVSGLTAFAERPAGVRLLVDAAAGAFDLVLVHRMDRLGRDMRIIQEVQTELRSRGVTVRRLTEPFDADRLDQRRAASCSLA